MKRMFTACLVGLAILSAACIRPDRRVEFTAKRVSLDVTFRDETKSQTPASAEELFIPQPTQASGLFVSQVARPSGREASPGTSPRQVCPQASPHATADEPASSTVTRPPQVGSYGTHNTGNYTLTSGDLKVSDRFPPNTPLRVENAEDAFTRFPEGEGGFPSGFAQWDIVQQGIDGTTNTTTYRATPEQLELIRLVTRSRDGSSSSFAPTPGVRIMEFRGEGATWRSAGIDPETGTSMVLEGKIESREFVDVCGEIFETWRVVTQERVSNPRTGFDSSTDPNKPNVYNIATRLGGLFLRQQVNTNTLYPTPNGGSARLILEVTLTFDRASPK